MGVESSLSHVSVKKAKSMFSESSVSAMSVACLTADLQFNRIQFSGNGVLLAFVVLIVVRWGGSLGECKGGGCLLDWISTGILLEGQVRGSV